MKNLVTLSLALLAILPSAAIAQYVAKERPLAGISEIPGKLVVYGHTMGEAGTTELAAQLPPEEENRGFVQVSGRAGYWGALRKDGTALFSGLVEDFEPQMEIAKSRIVRISVQDSHIAAIDGQGRGYFWHAHGTFPSPPSERLVDLVDIYAGQWQGYALTRDGRIIFWGGKMEWNDNRGQIFEPYQGQTIAIDACGRDGGLMNREGDIFLWSNDREKTEESITGLSPDLSDPAISASGEHYLFKDRDGRPAGRTGMSNNNLLPETMQRLHLHHGSFGLFEVSPREWRVFSTSNMNEKDAIQAFLDKHRPSAVTIVGAYKGENTSHPKIQGFGIVAIVPELASDSTPTTTSAPIEPMPEPSTPTATVEEPAEHGITDPRFLALLKLHQAEMTVNVQTTFDTALKALNEKLGAALEREEQKAIGSGDLDGVTAFRAERELLETDAVPATDDASVPTSLKRYRIAWRAAHAKLEAQRALDAAPIRSTFEEKLEALETTLTREEKIDEALKVRAFRTNLVPGTPVLGQ